MTTAVDQLLTLTGAAACRVFQNHMEVRLEHYPETISADDLESLSNRLGQMAWEKRRGEG